MSQSDRRSFDAWASMNSPVGAISRVKVAKVRNFTSDGRDALFIYNTNSTWCGSAGCALSLMVDKREVLSVNAGDGTNPGFMVTESMHYGMPDLYYEWGGVSWTFNGSSYNAR